MREVATCYLDPSSSACRIPTASECLPPSLLVQEMMHPSRSRRPYTSHVPIERITVPNRVRTPPVSIRIPIRSKDTVHIARFSFQVLLNSTTKSHVPPTAIQADRCDKLKTVMKIKCIADDKVRTVDWS